MCHMNIKALVEFRTTQDILLCTEVVERPRMFELWAAIRARCVSIGLDAEKGVIVNYDFGDRSGWVVPPKQDAASAMQSIVARDESPICQELMNL